MIDVLLDETHAIGEYLGDDRDVTGAFEFTAFVPYQQAARLGMRREPLRKARNGRRVLVRRSRKEVSSNTS